MSFKVSSREVLAHLNELGYTNITAQQLKDFMHDLKKLMKYEQKKEQSSFTSCTATSTPNSVKNLKNDDIFEMLYSHSTEASKAKIVPKSNKVIALEIRRTKTTPHEHCVHVCNKENKKTETIKVTPNSASSKEKVTVETQTTEEEQLKKTKSLCNNKAKATKKGSFIKPSFSKTTKKSDPVALYHQYQEEWKKIKFPGEYNKAEANLRWEIREKMACPRLKRI